MVGYFKSGAPFCEASAHFIVFFEAFREAFEALSPFFVRVVEVDEALVYLNTGDDAAVFEIVNESSAIIGNLTGGFIEENYAADIFFEVRRRKENIAIIAAMLFVVWNIHGFEFLMNTAAGFVRSEDALAWRH